MEMAVNEQPGAALRFGESALQVNLRWRGPVDLALTQAAVLSALGVAGALMSAPRLMVGLARFRHGVLWEAEAEEALAWPGPAAALEAQLSKFLHIRGAAPGPGAEGGLALASLGPVVARRVRVVLPPGVDLAAAQAGLAAEDARGRRLVTKVVPAEDGGSVWLQAPSTDLCSGFGLRISGAGEARLELSLGALVLDPSRDGRDDALPVAGAPLAAWRRAGQAHLATLQARLHDAGWAAP
jgi:hypothetical protein